MTEGCNLHKTDFKSTVADAFSTYFLPYDRFNHGKAIGKKYAFYCLQF